VIWVIDAMKQYKRGRTWFSEQIKYGRLAIYRFYGDRRVYLKRTEINEILGKPIIEVHAKIPDTPSKDSE